MSRALVRRLASALVPFVVAACGGDPSEPAPEHASEPAPVAAPAANGAPTPAPVAAVAATRRVRLDGPRAEVPAGSFEVGSVPGTPFRRASREADRVVVSMPAFTIDRRPYPNDPTLAPLLVATRREAESLCAERDGRLCTELEWERACGGPDASVYATGASMNLEECMRDPASCASGFGVMAMGIERAEWTASDVETRLGTRAVIRGARSDQGVDFHRCAARNEQPAAAAPDLPPVAAAAFHCCHGPAPEVAYPTPEAQRQFVDVTMTIDEIRSALRSVPELAGWADAFEPYDALDGDRALARGNATRGALQGWELTNGPFRWSPSQGDDALVVSGTSGEDTLIAVLYPRPDQGYWHAGSFVFEHEQTPIAISRTPPSREELLWTACQGCGGESGAIRLGEDGVIRVAAR
ncbi:MAG: hypothetical protein J0L92_22490 [Deltaproteobacteria bacterium]|nr:hypothetical protein [Deltaproteobacteria bacterium]